VTVVTEITGQVDLNKHNWTRPSSHRIARLHPQNPTSRYPRRREPGVRLQRSFPAAGSPLSRTPTIYKRLWCVSA